MLIKLEKLKIKVLDLKNEKSFYENMDLSELKLKDITTYAPLVDAQLIKKYYVTCFKNKKQPQSSNRTSGRKKVETPSGTNKGMSRQPRGSNGRRRIVVNVPNAVGGGQALPFSINQRSVKMNKKEKKAAIKLLVYYALRKANLYVVENHSSQLKDHAILKFIKAQASLSLREFLEDPVKKVINGKRYLKKGPVIIAESDEDQVLKRFKNYKKSLQVLNPHKTNYFGILKGYKYPESIITTRSALNKFLSDLYHEI